MYLRFTSLMLLAFLLSSCQTTTIETVSDQEKIEIQQLDSLVSNLAKTKSAEPSIKEIELRDEQEK